MKTRFAVVAIAAVICASCIPVPFDLALSQAAATVKKMIQDNPELLTLNNGTDPSARDFAFYPALTATGFDYTNGFVAYQRQLDLNLRLVQLNGSGTYDSYSQQSWPVGNPDPHAPPYAAWPAKSGPSYLLGFIFDALDPLNGSSYSLIAGDPVTHFISTVGGTMTMRLQPPDFPTIPPPPSSVVIGASVLADPSGTIDIMHWLARQNIFADTYGEFAYQVSSAGLALPVWHQGATWHNLPSFGIPIPNNLTRCMYFYDDNQGGDPARFPNRSFASWWDSASGKWMSYTWWGSPPTNNKQLPITHRLDALLSTGQLLSMEDGIGRLYTRDGDLKATFPLGNLVYLGEHYVGGVPRCYFSQSLIFDYAQHFNVYWIRTDELDTLDD